MPGRALRCAAALCLVLLAATACADGAGAPAESTPMGRTYISTEVTGSPIPGGGPLTLGFADGRITAEAGCNTHSGAVQFDEHILHVRELSSTLMACPEDRAQADGWLGELLRSEPGWRLDGDRLTLTGAETTVVLTDKKVLRPDRPVRNTEWVVTTLLTPEGQIRSHTIDAVRPAITLGADETLTGFAGCNRITGGATVAEGPDRTDVTFTAATTRMLCEPGVMEVEQAILAALDGTAEATVDADTLTLRNANGHGLVLRAE